MQSVTPPASSLSSTSREQEKKTQDPQLEYSPGFHVLLDFWGASHLANLEKIEEALRLAARTAGATILDVRLHQFGKEGGVTGVALLAESHISIHTWPETGFAALDVFMCGTCDARKTIDPLKQFFNPSRVKISEIDRG